MFAELLSTKKNLAENKREFDPRKFLTETLNAMKDIVVARYEAFGTVGNASKIKPVSLDAMSEYYLSEK